MLEDVSLSWMLPEEREQAEDFEAAAREADGQVAEFEALVAALLEEGRDLPSSLMLSGMRHYHRSQVARMDLQHHLEMCGQRRLRHQLEQLMEELAGFD